MANRKINAQQQLFIDNYCVHGNAAKAANAAGYADPKQRGYELRKRYSKEIADSIKDNIGDLMPSLLKVMTKIAIEEQSPALRLKACQDLMDRAGYKPVDRMESEIYNVDVKTTEELEAELEELLGDQDSLRLMQ
jgi:phage terminase small subunit